MMTLGAAARGAGAQLSRPVRRASCSRCRAISGCIARQNLGDAQRALLDYFANITTTPVEMPASIAAATR